MDRVSSRAKNTFFWKIRWRPKIQADLYLKLISDVVVCWHVLGTLTLLTSLRESDPVFWINFHMDLIKGEILTPVVFNDWRLFSSRFSRHGGWTSIGKNGDRAVVWWQGWGCSVAWRNHKAPTSNEWERTGDRGRQGAKNWVGIFCQTPQQGQGGFGKKRRKYLRINNGEKWGTKTRCRHTTYLQESWSFQP